MPKKQADGPDPNADLLECPAKLKAFDQHADRLWRALLRHAGLLNPAGKVSGPHDRVWRLRNVTSGELEKELAWQRLHEEPGRNETVRAKIWWHAAEGLITSGHIPERANDYPGLEPFMPSKWPPGQEVPAKLVVSSQPPSPPKLCVYERCKKAPDGTRAVVKPHQVYCSLSCRVMAFRLRKRKAAVPAQDGAEKGTEGRKK